MTTTPKKTRVRTKIPKLPKSPALSDGYHTLAGIITHSEIPPGNSHVEVKVQFIMKLMREIRWETGETGRILAQCWGQSFDMLKQYSSEASRRVKAEISDPEFVENVVSTALLDVIRDAKSAKDRKSIISASKVWADIVGASAQIRVKIAQETDVSKLSDEDLQALAEQAIQMIKDKK